MTGVIRSEHSGTVGKTFFRGKLVGSELEDCLKIRIFRKRCLIICLIASMGSYAFILCIRGEKYGRFNGGKGRYRFTSEVNEN